MNKRYKLNLADELTNATGQRILEEDLNSLKLDHTVEKWIEREVANHIV